MSRRKFRIGLAFNIIATVITALLLFFSTYGWYVTKANVSVSSKEHETLAKNLKKHVYILSHQIGWRGIDQYENLQKAEKYITESFQKTGLAVETQDFIIGGKLVKNIVAEKKGSKNPEKIVLVGAHYDTYFNPGADSNASGVGALLELADVFSKEESISATVRFVAFVNKEPPFFATEDMGSVVCVKRLVTAGETPAAVIILDSLGCYTDEAFSQRYLPGFGFFYPDKGNFIAVTSSIKSRNLLRIAESIFKKDVSLPVRGFIGFDFMNSDQWAFRKGGYDTILITDTGPYRNPNYYGLSDSFKKLNYLNIAQIVKGLATVIKTLAN